MEKKEKKLISQLITLLINWKTIGDQVDELIVFGSYPRGTILPSQFDPNSDIGLLIQFNIKIIIKLRPEVIGAN
jgi:predicted nucleotidyltransferase